MHRIALLHRVPAVRTVSAAGWRSTLEWRQQPAKAYGSLAARLALSFLLVTLSLRSLTAGAQSSSGSIVGTVTDSSGAVIGGASVTLTDTSTNQAQKTVTDGNGNYRFVQVLPSNYRIDVSANGFKGFSRSPVPVQVDSTTRVDTPLQIGSATEVVSVSTAPPLLQTDSGTLGSLIQEKQIQEIPLNGRNPLNLIALDPSVVVQGSAGGSAAVNGGGTHTTNVGWGNYQIGGGISGQSAQFLDGAPINTLGLNSIGFIPSQDIVQEFKISTNAVSAEFGRFSGGVVEFTTKNGGNDFHGTAYEYLRNNIFNANDFFSNHNGLPRPKFNQNQYGVVVSGPIKKDRAFFVGSWEGFSTRVGVATNAGVPSYNMEQGIFAKVIVDPTGKCPIRYFTAAGAATTATGAVATSVIPQSCFDPTGVAMEGYFPTPSASNPTNQAYFAAPVVGNNTNQYNGRIDYALSPQQRLFGRYSYWNVQDSSFRLYQPTVVNSGKSFSQNISHQVVLGDTVSFGPKTVLDLRASYLRQFYDQVAPSLGADPAPYGAGYTALEAQTSYRFIPSATFTGSDSLALGSFTYNELDTWNQYVLSGSLLHIFGKHTVQVGAEDRLLERNGIYIGGDQGGQFAFNSSVTALNGKGGDEFAGLLLGEFLSATVTTVSPVTSMNFAQGYYATDIWQTTRDLTLNYGLRWELPGAPYERHDRDTVFLPNMIDPVSGQPGAVVLVNSPYYSPRTVLPTKLNLFSPRLGLAYRLGSKMVLRAGYGLGYLPPDLIPAALATASPSNSANTSLATTTYHGLSDPYGVLEGFQVLQPFGRNPNFITRYKNGTLSSPIPTSLFPYMQQWNLSLSRDFKGALIEVGYAGAKGTHLPTNGTGQTQTYSINELGSQYYAGLQTMENAGATKAAIVAAGQAERPYPYFKNLYNTAVYNGDTSYEALIIKANKSFRNGGLLLVGYSWSKEIGDTDTLTPNLEAKGSGSTGSGGVYQDFNNPSGERSILSYDVPQRMIINYLTPLPFGHGQAYFRRVQGVADKLVSGWAVNGVTTFQAGFPLGLSESSGNYLSTQFGAGVIRPSVVPGCQRKLGGSPISRYNNGAGAWFNAACFVYAGDFAFGNQPRNDGALRTQGIDNFDFSVVKTTSVMDRFQVQFKTEVFNLFNHVQFAPPGLAIGGSFYNQVNTQQNQPRLIQFSLRLNY